MANRQKSSLKASKPIGNRAKTSSQPSNGNLSRLGLRAIQQSSAAAPISGPPAQPAGTTSALAIYIFEHDDHSHGKFCVFANDKRVFVIPTPAVTNMTPTMTKGLTYKVFLDVSDCPIKIMSLARLDHVLLSKVEIPTSDDYKSAPYFCCRVSVAKSTALHANFQILSLNHVNIQIPFNVIPDTLFLKDKDEHFVNVAFTTRSIRVDRFKALRRVPFVESGFFTFCNHLGENVPPPLPKYSMSPVSVAAVKQGFMANLVVGVPDGQHHDCLAVTGGNLQAWKVTRTTTAKSFLGSLASHLRAACAATTSTTAVTQRDAALLKYFEAHFSCLSSAGKAWSSAPDSSSSSRPTVVFFLGLSEALTVHVAEALALDLHRTYGISSRLVTPAAPHSVSDPSSFDELNTPKVSPLTRTLFRLSEFLQLGLLDHDMEYRYDLPELFLPFLAYDVVSDLSPASHGPMRLRSQEITISQQAPPDANYLTDPSSLHALFISSSESTTREHRLLQHISAAGAKHSPILDFTGRAGPKWIQTLALLNSVKQRDLLADKLKNINGVSCLHPGLYFASSTSSDTVVTVMFSPKFPANVLLKVLTDPRFGGSKDKMFVTSTTTVKMSLPLGLDQHEFTLRLQKFNSLSREECFINTLGAQGTYSVKGIRPRVVAPLPDPLAPRPFMVRGSFSLADNSAISAWAKAHGALHPRRVLREDRRTEVVLDLLPTKAAELSLQHLPWCSAPFCF